VIDPRGVLNGFTKTAAPASVARGGNLEIDGQNLGPDTGVTASGLPLPTQLGNPPIQVLIAGKAVPLFSATPNRILVQIPWNATVGASQVVVDRGGIQSTPVNFTIAAAVPAIQTANGRGYGVAGTLSGQTLSLSASGLGPTNKAVAAPLQPIIPRLSQPRHWLAILAASVRTSRRISPRRTSESSTSRSTCRQAQGPAI
jgi:uncharacterized protein (TIGR03437 family)